MAIKLLTYVDFFNDQQKQISYSNVNLIFVYHTENREKSAFILTSHGGHLGFYEGGIVRPNPVTWLDRTAVGISDAIIRDSRSIKSI